MKKLFGSLVIISVFSLGLVGALAAVPHSHGSDLDHSSHQSCPVHQAGLVKFHSEGSFGPVWIALLFSGFIFILRETKRNVLTRSFALLRAPPVL